MATYNGEKFINIQLDSILSQLTKFDEVVIVDDCSTDNTINIIKAINDSRIKLIINKENLGFVKTFEKALLNSVGELIFFSDQDDYWIDGRVRLMTDKLLNSNKYLIVSQYVTSHEQGTFDHTLSKKKISLNSFSLSSIFLGGSLFFGSTMCIKREILKYILPFRFYVKAHDLHLSIIAILLNKLIIIDEVLTVRTITGYNQTDPNRSFYKKVISRINYLFTLIFHIPLKYVIKK